MLSQFRKHKITGSQAGANLGLSPWRTREDVMQDWLYGSTFEGNAATEYGAFHEEYAIADFCLETMLDVRKDPGFYIMEEDNRYGATPDGLIGDDAVLEVKCPYGLRNDENPAFKSAAEQPHYYAQMQLEMLCTDRTKCYFYQWNRHATHLEIVELDKTWWLNHKPALDAFLADFQWRKASLNDDEQLASEYHHAKARLEDAKEALEVIKAEMIKRCTTDLQRTLAEVFLDFDGTSINDHARHWGLNQNSLHGAGRALKAILRDIVNEQ